MAIPLIQLLLINILIFVVMQVEIYVYFPKYRKGHSDSVSFRKTCLLRRRFQKSCALMICKLLLVICKLTVCSTQADSFVKNVSTFDELHNVFKYKAESKSRGAFTCLLALDIKSMFNSVRHGEWQCDV